MDWSPLERAFEDNFSRDDELGAAVAVWCARTDRPLLSLHEGWMERGRSRRWTADTLCPIWSATKGPSAWCLLQALADQGLGLELPLEEFWPQLGAANSSDHRPTLGDVLHHRLGLAAIDAVVDGLDHQAVCRALEAQRPDWAPGRAQGYHPRTFGWLLDELVRRIAGAASLGEFWDQRFRQRLDLDCWIGLPTPEHGRVASVVPGKWTSQHAEDPLYSRMNDPTSLQARAFRSPSVATRVADITSPEILTAGLGAFGGVAAAPALARFYAKLAGAMDAAVPLPADLASFSTQVADSAAREDRVLLRPVAFRGGFMAGFEAAEDPAATGAARPLFGRDQCRFGYPGAGGVLAFADPVRGLGFAYVMNQMELQVLPGVKARRLLAGFDEVLNPDSNTAQVSPI